MTEEIRELNNWLRESYGKTVTGKVRFRIIWSEDIFENRKGTFNEFYGKIFLRTVTGVRQVKKYNYISDRFILEGWVDTNMSFNEEVPEASHGDFTPIYVFEDSNGNPLPVTRKAVAFMIATIQGRVKKDNEDNEVDKEQKEIEKQVDTMMDHPEFTTHGPTRNSTAYTKNLNKKEDFKNVT